MKQYDGRGEKELPVCPPEILGASESRFCKLERIEENYVCRARGFCAIAAAMKISDPLERPRPEESLPPSAQD